LAQRALRMVAAQLSEPRRMRSCPRAVRQPVTGWPRLTKNHSHAGEIRYELTPVSNALS
jgi:hypothetical protein